MEDVSKPQTETERDSHKEYEALDAAPVSDPGPGGGKEPPAGTGESAGPRGEDAHKEGGDIQDLGDDAMGRPAGTSDVDDVGV